MTYLKKIMTFAQLAFLLIAFIWFLAFVLPGYIPGISVEVVENSDVGSINGSLAYMLECDPDEVAVGDIIFFEKGSISLTSRVVAIREKEKVFVTKGDSDAETMVGYGDVRGRISAYAPYMGAIPHIGTAYNWVRSHYMLFLVIAFVFVAWDCAVSIWDLCMTQRVRRIYGTKQARKRRQG